MGLWFLIISIIICTLIILSYKYNELNIIKLGAISVTLFWIIYSVISGVLFAFDKFSFISALAIQFALVLVVLVCLVCRKGWQPMHIKFVRSRDAIMLLLVFVAFLLTGTKFELFSTGQDQGLYQTEAMELFMGNYEVQHDFEEYQILEREEDRNAYREMLDKAWMGYYALKMSSYGNKEEAISDVSGMYHGVQTFPAMLALTGHLFGIENMMHLQTMFYICCFVLLYYTLSNMNVSKGLQIFLTMIFMLSPLTIWVSKATYTEMFLCLMVCFYLYLLFEENDEKWMLSIPLIGFAFVHVSFMVLWPVFWLANAIMYVYQKNKQYVYTNIISAVGLLGSCIMMARIAPQYYYGNCALLFVGNIVNQDNLLAWIGVISLVSCIVSIFMLRNNMEVLRRGLTKIQNLTWLVPVILILSVLFWIAYGTKMGFFMVPEDMREPSLYQYYGKGLMAYTHLGIYACALATGFVILPCLIVYMILKSKRIIADAKYFVLTLIFLYIVVFQSVFLRKEIGFYYYYSRYLLYYIPIICLMAAICFQKWNKKVTLFMALISFSSMIYFDVAIIENKDDTLWEWETLEDLVLAIEEDSAVIINGADMQRLLGPQVRTMADTAVFPVFENIQEQIELLQEHYECVYVLSGDDLAEDIWNKEVVKVAYKDQYQRSRKISHQWGMYPTEFEPVDMNIMLYRVDQTIYELGEEILFATENRNADKYVTQGISYDNIDYSWTTGDRLNLRLWVKQDVINKMVKATFEIKHVYNTIQEVQVYVNGKKVSCMQQVGGRNLEFEFEVSQEFVDINLVFPDAVSPQEIGNSTDTRKLALALVKATFVEEKVEAYETGEDIWFATEKKNSDKYVTQGLSNTENGYTWTVGDRLNMELCMDKDVKNKTVRACFEVRYVQNKIQEVQIYVNGNEVGSTIVEMGENLEFEFAVPEEIVELELVFPDAVSPHELTGGGDTRELALAFVKATFSEVKQKEILVSLRGGNISENDYSNTLL